MKEATALWNGAVERLTGQANGQAAGEQPKLGDRRFAANDWSANPSAALAAQTYLLNARTLMQMADAVEGDAKTKARMRFAVQQWIDAASPSNYLALQPRGTAQGGWRSKGESIAQGLEHLLDDMQQGHVSQTDESDVRGRPQRRHERRRSGVRERAVPADRIQAADGQGARAAAAVRAAVHQQVLHPRPAARQLADPLRGQPGASHLRRQLAQPRREHRRQDLGRLHRRRGHLRHPRGAGHQRPGDRSIRWASASAARSWRRRWPCWRRAASSRRRA